MKKHLKLSYDGELHVCEIAGLDMVELVSELGILIGKIYFQMHSTDPKFSKAFKKMMQAIISDESPTWTATETIGSGVGMFMKIPKTDKGGHEDA